jgi:hypothetical protein
VWPLERFVSEFEVALELPDGDKVFEFVEVFAE